MQQPHGKNRARNPVVAEAAAPAAILALEDGTIFRGQSAGAAGISAGEVVFNTAMSGYQEILTDPSYARQLVTLTCAHVGNVGVTAEDCESRRVFCGGLIVKHMPRRHSNWRAQSDLREFLRARGVVAICGVDTRKLTRILRSGGAQRGAIFAAGDGGFGDGVGGGGSVSSDVYVNECGVGDGGVGDGGVGDGGVGDGGVGDGGVGDGGVSDGGVSDGVNIGGGSDGGESNGDDTTATTRALTAARNFPGLAGMDLAKEVTTERAYHWRGGGCWSLRGYAPAARAKFRVVACDYGVKNNLLRNLAARGCEMEVLPARASAHEILARKPHGVFLSNGPGDPAACSYAIDAIRELLAKKIPLFGICLGHQLMALAGGARTSKMKFGHHGANHPVRDVDTGRVLITSQNHGFAVRAESVPANARVTHVSLFDGSVQGLQWNDAPAFSFQGHPEASPGPHDAEDLFARFTEMMAQHMRARDA